MKILTFHHGVMPPRFTAAMVLIHAFIALSASAAPAGFKLAPFIPNADKRAYLQHTNLYIQDRQKLTAQHLQQRLDIAHPNASAPEELKLSDWIQQQVVETYELRREGSKCLPTRPFYETKGRIGQSPLFQALRRMPKGALLHSHINALGRMDWIITNALAMPNCCVRWGANAGNMRGELRISDGLPEGFTRIAALRDDPAFAQELRKELTIGAEDAIHGSAWIPFADIFGKLSPFIDRPEVFQNYLVDAFETLFQDGIRIVEMRDSSRTLDRDYWAQRVDAILSAQKIIRFRHTNDNFAVRLIVSGVRSDNTTNLLERLRLTAQLRASLPQLIAGFDLVGGEDDNVVEGATFSRVSSLLPKLREFAMSGNVPQDELFKKISSRRLPSVVIPEIDYFLHEGESLWADNDNLFDAILLETPRIGHAFNLYRFPSLYPILVAKKIALEICPISNQLLRLTPDLRAHPALGYINAGIPCSLSSDDPAIFGNDGLSYDFYVAAVAWNLDLSALKQLARNSIQYSSLDEDAKSEALRTWTQQWDSFVKNVHPGPQ